MNTTIKQVMEFVSENDVKFIRLAFCDILGTQKNISIMPSQLESAFENGVSFDASAIEGFGDVSKSDLLLFPDFDTLSVLPWRPQQGRVIRFFCDIKNPDGTVFERDPRAVLIKTVEKLKKAGYSPQIGLECEFYLFKTNEMGEPSFELFDHGGYFDIAPLDKGENVRREICLTLEEMGIYPESSHHEHGPGQNEIDFMFADAVKSADNLVAFKSVVKAIAERNGLYASFMPKPLIKESGSGMHVNISLLRSGTNIFSLATDEAGGFVQGVLNRAREMTALLNPIPNSYLRLGEFEAPKYVSWSRGNRSQLVRIPAAPSERSRMELRSPDPAANPYLALALILSAGLEGLNQKLSLEPQVDSDLYTADTSVTDKLEKLPESLGKAVELLRQSEFAKGVLGEELLEEYATVKEQGPTDIFEEHFKFI